MKTVWYMESPVGELTLGEEDGALTHLLFGHVVFEGAGEEKTPLLAEAQKQLEEYFSGERHAFSLPLCPKGTEFQKRVWESLRAIPYGETRTYQQIAEAAGSPRACRAAGMANHCNPISILVPCHRVIGKDGSLTGYGGGLKAKQYLLDLERQFSDRTLFQKGSRGVGWNPTT